MKHIIFTHNSYNSCDLYPFSLTRKVQDMRVGIFTIKEKWEQLLHAVAMDEPVGEGLSQQKHCYFIAANLLPNASLMAAVYTLQPGEAIYSEKGERAFYFGTAATLSQNIDTTFTTGKIIVKELRFIQYSWQFFQYNQAALVFDYSCIQKNGVSALPHSSNYVSSVEQLFIAPNAVVKNCSINTDEGPVYIGNHAWVMEGCCLRGPVSIGEGAVVKMGAKIYGATTIGPGCTVGGEIKNSVLLGYTNKAHDGYMGDSVIGEWCNWGAGTSNSNLKNTAGDIDVHLPHKKYKVGNKCGVLMGDFSRTAINTTINTGCVIGVSTHVFGSGLTPKHLPSFAWGWQPQGLKYNIDKALQDAHRWKQLKGKILTTAESSVLKNIYNNTVNSI